ncbi:MAG: hypothetical protein RR994_06135, partial [Clostridia bacterium]
MSAKRSKNAVVSITSDCFRMACALYVRTVIGASEVAKTAVLQSKTSDFALLANTLLKAYWFSG